MDLSKSGELGLKSAYHRIKKYCNTNQPIDNFLNNQLKKYNLKDYSGAISEYNKAIEVNPKNIEAYFKIANSKDNLQDYRERFNIIIR